MFSLSPPPLLLAHPMFGGLVGVNYETISNSYAAGGTVSIESENGDVYIGGLGGYYSNGTISNSYATGTVSIDSINGDAYVGGLGGIILTGP